MPVAKSFDFYHAFEQVSAHTVKAATELLAIFQGKSADAQVTVIKELEHAADDATHSVLERLNKTYNTPFERDDIFGLITALDDVMDLIHACAGRVAVYQLTNMLPIFVSMAQTILSAVNETNSAVTKLRDAKNRTRVLDHCVEVNRAENIVDDLLRDGLRSLFSNEKNPIELIKAKETMEALEHTSDACERVAHRIEAVVLKHA